MSLPYDVCRCAGQQVDTTCPHRNDCARAVEFWTNGERVPKAAWLCETPEFERRIPLEV